MAGLIEDLDSIDWDAAIRAQLSAQEKTDVFYDTKLEIMDINLPLRSSLIRNDKPWMTEEIKELIIDRQRLFHTNESELKELAKRVKVLIEKRKEEYYGQLGNKNPKELWQRINEHRSNTKQEIFAKNSAEFTRNSPRILNFFFFLSGIFLHFKKILIFSIFCKENFPNSPGIRQEFSRVQCIGTPL
jgi:hypothetical protein